MLPRKKRSRSSSPLWWASASAVISSRFTLALLPHARTDVVFAVRLRETLHRCGKFGLCSVPPCGSTAPSKQRQPALGQLSSAQSNPFMTFEIGAAILLLQGQRQVAKLRKAAVQRGSSDLVDATPITSGSDAQEAAAAKLRTVFALRNLIGPNLPFAIKTDAATWPLKGDVRCNRKSRDQGKVGTAGNSPYRTGMSSCT